MKKNYKSKTTNEINLEKVKNASHSDINSRLFITLENDIMPLNEWADDVKESSSNQRKNDIDDLYNELNEFKY